MTSSDKLMEILKAYRVFSKLRDELHDVITSYIKEDIIQGNEHEEGGYMAPIRNSLRAEQRARLRGGSDETPVAYPASVS